MSVTEPPTVVEPEAGNRCPSCLSLHRPGQRFCLECGARLTEDGLPPAERGSGAPLSTRQRVGLAAGAVLLVLLGSLIAWALSHDDDGTREVVLTAPAHSIPSPTESAAAGVTDVPAAPTDPGLTDPGLTDDGTTLPVTPTESVPEFTDDIPTDETPGAETEEEPPVTDDDGLGDEEEPPDEWPGIDAWAVILISKEVDQFDAAYMESLRADAQSRGLGSLGILFSDNWSSLNPGFRVLYQGPFDTREEADRAAIAAKRAGYEFAYPRRVAP